MFSRKSILNYFHKLMNIFTNKNTRVCCAFLPTPPVCSCVPGVRVFRALLLPTRRPPDADQTRHHPDPAAHGAASSGVQVVLCADQAQSYLHPVHRRAGGRHVQVQVRRHGRRRVRLSIAGPTGFKTSTKLAALLSRPHATQSAASNEY